MNGLSNTKMPFFLTKGGSHIPHALKVIQGKVAPQLMYGSQVFLYNNYLKLGAMQSKFLRSLFGGP